MPEFFYGKRPFFGLLTEFASPIVTPAAGTPFETSRIWLESWCFFFCAKVRTDSSRRSAEIFFFSYSIFKLLFLEPDAGITAAKERASSFSGLPPPATPTLPMIWPLQESAIRQSGLLKNLISPKKLTPYGRWITSLGFPKIDSRWSSNRKRFRADSQWFPRNKIIAATQTVRIFYTCLIENPVMKKF